MPTQCPSTSFADDGLALNASLLAVIVTAVDGFWSFNGPIGPQLMVS
jgi:hypothetical protein